MWPGSVVRRESSRCVLTGGWWHTVAGRCHTAGTRHGVLCLHSTTPPPGNTGGGGEGGAIYRSEFYPAESELCRSPGAGGGGGESDQYVATNKE